MLVPNLMLICVVASRDSGLARSTVSFEPSACAPDEVTCHVYCSLALHSRETEHSRARQLCAFRRHRALHPLHLA